MKILPLLLLLTACPQEVSNTYSTTTDANGYTCKRIVNPQGEVIQKNCFYPTSPNEVDYN
jgi:hypothetical protein